MSLDDGWERNAERRDHLKANISIVPFHQINFDIQEAMTCVPSVSNAFIQVLLVMVLVSHVLPLPLAAHLPVYESLYDEPPLADYNFVPYSGLRNNGDWMNEPFRADKRKNEFIRFGKRDDFMKFNKRKNEFIRFGKRSIN
uniref:Bm1088 n=2 Tax=Brugia malayi TaxID=6279 RepID=A0A0J9Y6Y3_BRUMA|nr:Bm1088 [Brugia malayi]